MQLDRDNQILPSSIFESCLTLDRASFWQILVAETLLVFRVLNYFS